MKNSYKIRKATLNDIPLIRNVIEKAMSQYVETSKIPGKTDSLTETDIDIEKHISNDHFLVALHDNRIVGTIRLSKFNGTLVKSSLYANIHTASNHSKIAYISRFAVVPDLQHKGVGSVLFGAAEDYCINNGYDFVALHTAVNNDELVKFYKNRNFELLEINIDRGYDRGTFIKQIH